MGKAAKPKEDHPFNNRIVFLLGNSATSLGQAYVQIPPVLRKLVDINRWRVASVAEPKRTSLRSQSVTFFAFVPI